ncbi:MAG: YihY/virulence factor BrkB family protein [Ilumatobacter sp.]
MRWLVDSVKRVLDLKLVREINEDGLFDVAAGVAFWLVLSLPAALLAGLASVSLLGDGLTAELRDLTDEFLSTVFADQYEPLSEAIDDIFDQQRTGVLSASIAVALFTVSRGFAGLVRGLDQVYDIEETRNFLHTRLLSIGLAIGTLLTVAGSVAGWVAMRDAGVPILPRLVLAMVVLVLWSATMFHVGPNHHTPWKYDLPGALIAAVGWLGLSLGYGWYVRVLGGGGANEVIGLAGALLLGLTWIWAACGVLLVGGEVNEILARRAGVVSKNRTLVGRVRAVRTRRSNETVADPSDSDDG